jgi:hypothetical protein
MTQQQEIRQLIRVQLQETAARSKLLCAMAKEIVEEAVALRRELEIKRAKADSRNPPDEE